MIHLYVYPGLFGLPSNSPFDLKVDTVFRLIDIEFILHNILDASDAPRQQCPYLKDGDRVIGDSGVIIKDVIQANKSQIDFDLTVQQQSLTHAITRMLDGHLYWVMAYSRWQDERYYPQFRDAFLANVSDISSEDLSTFRSHNIKKYEIQGIGRYDADEIYQAGIDDIVAIDNILEDDDYIFGHKVHIVDAVCYGYLANIFYFPIETPLKQCIVEHARLVQYIARIRAQLGY